MLPLGEMFQLGKKFVADAEDEAFDVRLEQAEVDSQGNWDITVSFLAKNYNRADTEKVNIFTQVAAPYTRVYKRMIITQKGELVKYLISNVK